uniref:EF-hand domain-containing protein n=1 Tax=Haptolina brevifila TaxID=156173 RepID=A0A6U7DPL6_9EUKA|mmetsp:Transcript_27829/g.55994  ORF Transcript_27829/g.55994 Transcript_27829/m.55994 type:complete len:195 (+) Transcript_27829:89-673(+)
MTTREEQRREHNEQKELESLRRVFEHLDTNKDQKIDFKELDAQLKKLDYQAKRVEVEDMIWEVDEDCDHCVSWDEFKLMFHRCRQDKTGLEPRKLFNVVEFMMHDKDSSGTIDMDECMEILFRRFGKEQLEERTNDFFKHDTDGDNAISFAEFQKQMQAIRPKRRDTKAGKTNASTTSITSIGGAKGGRVPGRR